MTRTNEKDQTVDTRIDVLSENVSFSYAHAEESPVLAVDKVTLSLPTGGYYALLGRNGSGKSTLAKLINILEIPSDGNLAVFGYDTRDESHFWEIRSSCGMVFQNPDNQIVGTTVEEDVAFGPENLGVPTEEIRKRVDEALAYVGMSEFSRRQPSQLSGGQKQKLAIAGILAMQPRILLLDESTSMLDPVSRDEFLAVVGRLVREKSLTVLHITHDMAEASLADRIFVLDRGSLKMEGTPGEVFSRVEEIRALGLDVPVYADIAYETAVLLRRPIPREALSSRSASLSYVTEALSDRWALPLFEPGADQPVEAPPRDILTVKDLSFSYDSKGEKALADISFSVKEGEIFAIIGHSGSGKTTLISHLNGLLRPQTGEILLSLKADEPTLTTRKNADVKRIRQSVGLLFQYPEYQLFEETVEKDIRFGPSRMGLSPEETARRVREAIELVGLDEEVMTRSPFELSGGQKRRVAFAGILAMDPDILVLDEPAAGLDPTGRQEIFTYIRELKKRGKTVILVSHNMDEAARYADRILVLRKGRILAIGKPEDLFSDREAATSLGLHLPETIAFLEDLRATYPDIQPRYFDPKGAAREGIRAASEGGRTR